MLTLNTTGIPGIVCGKCQEPVSVEMALVLKFKTLISVQFVCVDCAEQLKEKYPDADFVLARTYFEGLLTTGRPKRIPLGRS